MTRDSDPGAALGVLISGRGSNLRAIASAVAASEIPGSVAVVISNEPQAAGLQFARERGIPTVILRHGDYPSRLEYDNALVAELASRGVTLVCLAGFMRLLGPAFCAAFPFAVLNIHPSLLPSFRGTHAQRQALEYGVKVTGATVHFVTPELDGGPIIMQAPVPVEDGDTEATLEARILEAEHRLYPRAIAEVLRGRWRLAGRRVVFDRPVRQV
jgi:phosphoribosylglycinamide formyltransferase-1